MIIFEDRFPPHFSCAPTTERRCEGGERDCKNPLSTKYFTSWLFLRDILSLKYSSSCHGGVCKYEAVCKESRSDVMTFGRPEKEMKIVVKPRV